MKNIGIKNRLEYLRQELREERISQGELIELQSLAKYINEGDVELLEAAGVSEFPEEDDSERVSVEVHNIDLGLLKKQKLRLLSIVSIPELSKVDRDAIDGVIHLLDAIQDEAEKQK